MSTAENSTPVSKNNDGWCGEPCPVCKGTGEKDDQTFGRQPCGGCGGTGEWYVSALDKREQA